MAAKKVFELNEASFVDLKAELIRKESQVKREKLGSEQKISRQPKKPPVWAKVKKETKEANSASPHKQEELSYEEQQILQKSRQALEAKAALYEKMAKGEIEDDDDNEDGGRFLVDFHKKVYSKDDENQESEGLKDEDIPPPSGPEEEWVDYVDSLGRARRCLRKDLKQLQDMDKDMNARKSPPTLLSEDMRREMIRQQWEQEEEEAMNKPVGPLHYQDIRFDEIRNHGVGYYQFSTNEEERQEQMKTLDKLREQTMEQRVRAQKLKDKRKAALDARLAKVRERKLKKLKASGASNEERIEESENTEDKEEDSSDITREKTTEEAEGKENSSEFDGGKTTRKAGVEDRLHVLPPEDETVYSRKPERKAALPEWAQHKIKQTDRPRPSRTDPREERDQQFAPPAFYYEQSAGGKTTNNSRKEPSKLLKPEENINHYGQEQKSENLKTPYQGQQTENLPQASQNQLPQQQLPHHPDFPLLPPPPQEYVRPTWTGYQWQPPPRMPPPPFPQQLPWLLNFPFNVPPPPPSVRGPNIPPWQPHHGPPPIRTVPTSLTHAVSSENPLNSNIALLGGSSKSDCTSSISSENVETNSQGDKLRDRAIPSKQDVAEFVAQFRS